MLRVGHVGCSLGMGADGEEGDEGGMDYGGEERVEDVADVHDSLAEKQEEGENGDDDIEVCYALRTQSVNRRILLKNIMSDRTYN